MRRRSPIFFSKLVVHFRKDGCPLFDAEFQLFFRLFQKPSLSRDALSDPCEFDESAQIPVRVSQRRDYDACPKREPSCGFANLVFALPFCAASPQVEFRLHSVCPSARKIRRVFSEDFARAVAFQALGARVPADDVAQGSS